MDKKQRRDKEFYVYKKRLRKWMSSGRIFINREEDYCFDLKWIEFYKDRAQYKLRHTATLCSCYGCSGYYKYRRYEEKIEFRRLLKEYYEEL